MYRQEETSVTVSIRDLLLQGAEYADQWVAYRRELRDIPGITVAIRYRDDLLLSCGYGLANIEQQVPMTPQHIFRVASHSKTFTATAILQLWEQGKLRLDDGLGQFIPWLASQPIGKVTVRQVLNHSGGIIRDGLDADHWQLDKPFPDEAELRHIVEHGGVVLDANERFKYSNVGYSLLGLVIEQLSGTSYHDYVRHNIVERLGLADSGPETDAAVRERMATGYTAPRLGVARMPIPDISTGSMAAATGFYSTADDLSRYALAHCRGNNVLLTDAAKREMQQPYWAVEDADQHYGLGLSVTDIGDRRVVGHGGGFPGHATATMVDPKEGLAVIVLTNQTRGPAGAIATCIVKILNFALTSTTQADEHAGSALASFTGRYMNMWGVTDIVRFGEALVELDPDADDPVLHPARLTIEDGDTLRIATAGGYASPGEQIRYVRDSAGSITRIIDGGVSYYPPEDYRRRVATT